MPMRNFQVQRSDAVLVILKYALISTNKFVLSEMEGNLFFLTIFLPDFISDQIVRLAFYNFGEAVYVFKGRHRFNTEVRNGKKAC